MTRIEKYLFAAAILTTGFSVAWQFRRDPASLVHEMDLATTTDSMIYRPSDAKKNPPASGPKLPVAAVATLPEDEEIHSATAPEVAQIPSIERSGEPPSLPRQFNTGEAAEPDNQDAEEQDAESVVEPIRSSALEDDDAASVAPEKNSDQSDMQDVAEDETMVAENGGNNPDEETPNLESVGRDNGDDTPQVEAPESEQPTDRTSGNDESGDVKASKNAASDEASTTGSSATEAASDEAASDEAPSDDEAADPEGVNANPVTDEATIVDEALADDTGAAETQEGNVESEFAAPEERQSHQEETADKEAWDSSPPASAQPQVTGELPTERTVENPEAKNEQASITGESDKQPVNRAEPVEKPTATEAIASSDADKPAAAGSEPTAARPIKWKIRDGDTLETIAYRLFGDSRYWRLIFFANRDKLSDPRLLPIGLEIDVPASRNDMNRATPPSDSPKAKPTRTSEVGALPMISLPSMPVSKDR